MVLSVRSILRLNNRIEHRLPTFSACRYLNYQLHKQFNDEELQKDLASKVKRFKHKILYNSQLHGENFCYTSQMIKKQEEAMKEKYEYMRMQKREPMSFCLNYFYDETPKKKKEKGYEYREEEPIFQLPYGETAKVLDETAPQSKNDIRNSREWMKDYEFFDDTKFKRPLHKVHTEPTLAQQLALNQTFESDISVKSLSRNEDTDWADQYGKPDLMAKISRVPCGGCGALLHCNDTGLPGYLPSEIFKDRRAEELMSMICQRCHFLKEYNIALNLRVAPEEYVELLEKIKPDKALVVLLIDLLDFPCSIWPGMLDIIGEKRPIIVVGNKVDLLPRDCNNYLANVESSLRDSIINSDIRKSNIKHIALISAKTGYGVEKLINKLHLIWKFQGNVYLIGCTNSGKSTLFNALLRSDYCNVSARDLVKRATISQWPGTTMNLLKFPILRPADWRLVMRIQRLAQEKKFQKPLEEEKMRMLRETNKSKYATLVGYIGQTFMKNDEDDEQDPFTISGDNNPDRSGIDLESDEYKLSKWCYDTPGVIHPDQILTLLTLDELLLTVPKYQLRPRTFWMKQGMTLFIAGLGRLDVQESEHPLQLTVFAASNLPVTVCRTKDAEELYAELLGTPAFTVPFGNEERMKNWPALKNKDSFSVVGSGKRKSTADIVLSSAGWVAVAGRVGENSKLLAWTPNGNGIHLRKPSVLPYALNLKGNRMGKTPAYKLGSPFKKTAES